MIVRQIGRFSRECGCEWEIIPVAGQSERVRQAGFGNPVARFTHRCDDHDVMCRGLEPWELRVFDSPSLITEVDDSLVHLEAPSGGWPDCDCGHEGQDEMFHLGLCPVAVRWRERRKAAQ